VSASVIDNRQTINRKEAFLLGHICDVCKTVRTLQIHSTKYICSHCLSQLQDKYRKWKNEVCLNCKRSDCFLCVIPETRNISFAEFIDRYLELE